MKTFSKLTLASVSVLALLTLAACGNSKDKTDSSSSTTSSSKVTKESSSTDSSASVKVNKDGSTEVSDGNGTQQKQTAIILSKPTIAKVTAQQLAKMVQSKLTAKTVPMSKLVQTELSQLVTNKIR